MKRIRKSFYGIWDNKFIILLESIIPRQGCNGSHAWAGAAMPLGRTRVQMRVQPLAACIP
jgi:hypothetical protein